MTHDAEASNSGPCICRGYFEEPHFTIAEIAAMWRISREKARRLFHDEPGVIRFHEPESDGREYNSYRIPV